MRYSMTSATVPLHEFLLSNYLVPFIEDNWPRRDGTKDHRYTINTSTMQPVFVYRDSDDTQNARWIANNTSWTAVMFLLDVVYSVPIPLSPSSLWPIHDTRTFFDVQDLIEQAKILSACGSGIERAKQCSSVEQLLDKLTNDDIMWLIERGFVHFFPELPRVIYDLPFFNYKNLFPIYACFPQAYDPDNVATEWSDEHRGKLAFLLYCFTDLPMKPELIATMKDKHRELAMEIRPDRDNNKLCVYR